MGDIRRVAFFVRSYNDVDHFVPLIAEFVRRSENPLIIVNTDFHLDLDYRVKYLRSLGDFEILNDIDREYTNVSTARGWFGKLVTKAYSIKRDRKGFLGKIYRRFFFKCDKQMEILREKRIDICAFEWSTPFARGELVEKYFIAAKGIGITTIAIPHGCNIFLNSDVTIGYRNLIRRGEIPDQSDTRYFDYYVLQNPIRRDGWIKWGFDPVKTQAWGSVRFFPQWAEINRTICPQYKVDYDVRDKVKVVFMQFQKEYNVQNKMVFETLERLSHLKHVALVVKDATREGKHFYDRKTTAGALGESLVGWYGNEVHSPALIDWADAVIVIGGSIGIEVMLQKKVLIYPLYLNTNSTLYEYFNAAYCSETYEDLEGTIQRLVVGEEIPELPGVKNMINEIVYAGKGEFDVPMAYYEHFKSRNLNYAK